MSTYFMSCIYSLLYISGALLTYTVPYYLFLAQCQVKYIVTHITGNLQLSGWWMAIDHPDPTLITVTHIKNHFQIRLLTTVSFSLN